METTNALALVAQTAEQLRGLLDQIDTGQMDAEEETRLRIEGGVVALDAVLFALTDEDNEEAEDDLPADVAAEQDAPGESSAFRK